MQTHSYGLVVVGAGAGGIATAYAASRLGVKTLLVEYDCEIGGTATRAGVSVWEMGVGGTGISREIYYRLRQIPQAVGIYSFGHHCSWPKPGGPVYPGGQLVIDDTKIYDDTLRRYGANTGSSSEDFIRQTWHGVVIEPEALINVTRQMLQETGCCDIWCNSEITQIKTSKNKIVSCQIRRDGERHFITAPFWVDCTGNASFCAKLGCEMMFGAEAQSTFDEPDAPLEASDDLNGVTLMYRISHDAEGWLQPPVPLHGEAAPLCGASISQFPNGDWLVNMLPTMTGREYYSMTSEAAYLECLHRIWRHWHWLQNQWSDFQSFGICWIAPRSGVREGPRVVGDHILTENDLLAGISRQGHEDIIALADHAIDLHGSTHGSGCHEVNEPYGIPFRCLLPKGWDNLLIACRGASFSHIATASCRLTRTMMQLGQAAGTAVALAMQQDCLLREVPEKYLCELLQVQGVVLDYRKLPGAMPGIK